MRKWLRPDWRARLLDLFACFLIPLYTLLFTHDTRWFTTNFSVIAAARDQRHGFFLWGMLVGVYLLCVLLPVMAALPRPLWPRLCLLGGFLLLSAVGRLPGMIGCLLMGTMVENGNYTGVIILAVLAVIACGLCLFYRKKINAWLDKMHKKIVR